MAEVRSTLEEKVVEAVREGRPASTRGTMPRPSPVAAAIYALAAMRWCGAA